VLRKAATGRVERIAVLRVAEPLRRAALAALELTLAPEADRVDCSRSYQAGIAVHNVLLNLRKPASGGIVPDCGKAVSRLRPLAVTEFSL